MTHYFCWRGLLPAVVVLSASLFASRAPAQSREFDDWTGFKPGSWCEVRTRTESLNDQGDVTGSSTTRTRVTIVRALADLVELKVATVVDDAGKQHTTESQIVLSPHGRAEGEQIALSDLASEKIQVDDAKHDCLVTKAELTGKRGRRTVTTFFRPAAPHAPLRRVINVSDAEGNSQHSITSEAVVLDMPHAINDRIHDAMLVRTVFKNHKASSTTFSVQTPAVPGQMVKSSTKEYDAQGRLAKLVSQEVVDYGLPAEETKGTTIRERIKERRERRRR